ncbi:hypothetical protein C9994_05145 [Marivirga lumbricoides]|uniref:HEAT repeat domain-containing protein n=1 Tax=Marivirga lumbricoides TaxID=1046115 RepID=A0A2T4DSU3_9BACT|nr:hypothetical protein C9994_05145 [Marivirga lumbricoides]
MKNQDQHIDNLSKSANWIDYLKENSGLPGKRANLELLMIVVNLGDEEFFKSCLTYNEKIAPTNTKGEFVAMCGVTGLGKLITRGKQEYFFLLKEYASDSRWRVREGVAFALQIIGENDFGMLIPGIQKWITGNNYEKRAVVVGLCEPKLLKDRSNAHNVIEILNQIMESIHLISDRKSESFRVLKKGLGYGLSVAIVAYPEMGKIIFEKLMLKSDKDIQWIVRENLKKKRLEKMDMDWTNRMKNACT